jgi:hypothetical protein
MSSAEYARNFEVITDGSARHQHTFPHRGFLPWRFSDAGPQQALASHLGRHPKTFTLAEEQGRTRGLS